MTTVLVIAIVGFTIAALVAPKVLLWHHNRLVDKYEQDRDALEEK